jgi:hypothetical protein
VAVRPSGKVKVPSAASPGRPSDKLLEEELAAHPVDERFIVPGRSAAGWRLSTAM